MKCELCGFENADRGKFCGKCGNRLPQSESGAAKAVFPVNGAAETVATTQNNIETAAIPEPAKSVPPKKIIAISIAAVFVIALLFAVLPKMGGGVSSKSKNCIYVFDLGDHVAVSVNNDEKITIDGSLDAHTISMDKSTAVVLADDVLWYVSGSDKTKVAEDVECYVFADSGKAIAYFTDYDDDNEVATLHLYDCSSKKSTKIKEDVYCDGRYGTMLVCLSPDGKSIGYITDYDEDAQELYGYVKINGKSAEKLGKNMACLAIADGGKYIYYVKLDDDSASLHVKKGKDDVKLISDLSFDGPMFLNKDYSQIVFNYNEKAHISRDGKDKEKISNSPISEFVLPKGSHTTYSIDEFGWDTLFRVYGISDFAGSVANVSDESLLYIDDKYESSEISSLSYSGGYPFLCSDEKTVMFIDSSKRLCKTDATNPDAEATTLAEDVTVFNASDSGSVVYYINKARELWCVKGNEEPSKISKDASDFDGIVVFGDKAFFVDRSDALYYSDNGGEKAKVSGDVISVFATDTNVFYYSTNGKNSRNYEIYRSNGNEKFTEFESGAYYYYSAE